VPGPASTPVADKEQYAAYISANTGFDPRVVEAWISGEGHPGDLPGYFNFMNIQAATAAYNHDPYVGVGPANTAIFGSIDRGEKAALDEINALHLGNESGKTIAQQISDIAASPWASSHYGGPGGPNLVRDFQGMYPGVNIGGAAQKSPYAGAGGGGIDLNPADAIGGLFGHPVGAIEGIVMRGLMILGGTLVVLIGLYFIVRAFGLAPGVTDIIPIARVAKKIPGGGGGGKERIPVAAQRGEEVTKTSRPQAHTPKTKRAYERQQERTQRAENKTKRDAARQRDRQFGGADDIPF
jgi:hypothetical protein